MKRVYKQKKFWNRKDNLKKKVKRKRKKRTILIIQFENRYICKQCDHEWTEDLDVKYGTSDCPICKYKNITPYVSKEIKGIY